MTRAHRLQITAIVLAAVIGITSVTLGVWNALAKAGKGNTSNSYNQIINVPAPSEPAGPPTDPNRGCSARVDDSTGGWGPARLILNKDDLLQWPGFNQDNMPSGYGDERDFYTGGIANATNDQEAINAVGVEKFSSKIKVERGKYYVLRIYIHNSAGEAEDKVTTNTRVSVSLPNCTGRQIASNAFIAADNAEPKQVYDGVSFWGDEDFNLAFVAGSARMCNNFFTCKIDGSTHGLALPDDIMTSHAALLGYDKLDGRFRGNYKYSAYVYITVRAQFAPK